MVRKSHLGISAVCLMGFLTMALFQNCSSRSSDELGSAASIPVVGSKCSADGEQSIHTRNLAETKLCDVGYAGRIFLAYEVEDFYTCLNGIWALTSSIKSLKNSDDKCVDIGAGIPSGVTPVRPPRQCSGGLAEGQTGTQTENGAAQDIGCPQGTTGSNFVRRVVTRTVECKNSYIIVLNEVVTTETVTYNCVP